MTTAAKIITSQHAAHMILERRKQVPRRRSVLVGISGIDGSGKGFITAQLAALLAKQNCRTAVIKIDAWLQLPDKRFDPARPAAHFLEDGIRFDEMFSKLILPLREDRSLQLTADLADAGNTPDYVKHTYAFENVDVILLEGIFLFQSRYRRHFDITVWIDCTFETALERALARGQEGLPPDEVVRDYQTIYFPAQRLHFERDNPRAAATAIIVNDSRLDASSGRALASPDMKFSVTS